MVPFGPESNMEQHERADCDSAPYVTPLYGPMRKLFQCLNVAILCASHLLTQACLGQALAPLPILGLALGSTSLLESNWYIAAYSLTVGCFVPISGRLGDVYGHRRMIIIGYGWFCIWSLVCGLAVYSGSTLFIVSRAFQGIGPALLLPNSLAILGNLFPPGTRKNIAFSLFAASAPIGFVLGSLFSSLFAELLWWPWAYWATAITCFFCAWLTFLIAPSPVPGSGIEQRIRRLDLLGSCSVVAGLVLVSFAWNQAAAVGWTTPYTYTLFAVGVVMLCLFLWVEKSSSYPLVPPNLLTVDTGFVLTCIACGWSSFGIWLFYAWHVSEEIIGYSPLHVVAHFTPVAVSGAIAALSTAYLLGRLGPYYIMTASMASFLVGSILFATAPPSQIYWIQQFLSIIIMPWGMDLSYPSGSLLLSNSSQRHHQGISASLLNTIVNYSISLGLGMAGTVESELGKRGNDRLTAVRGAQYLGIGMSGMGLILSLVYLFICKRLRGSIPHAGPNVREKAW